MIRHLGSNELVTIEWGRWWSKPSGDFREALGDSGPPRAVGSEHTREVGKAGSVGLPGSLLRPPLLVMGVTAGLSQAGVQGEEGRPVPAWTPQRGPSPVNLMSAVSSPSPESMCTQTRTFTYRLGPLRIQWSPLLVSLELFPPTSICEDCKQQPLYLDPGINAPNIVLASSVRGWYQRGLWVARATASLDGLAVVRRGARPPSKATQAGHPGQSSVRTSP